MKFMQVAAWSTQLKVSKRRGNSKSKGGRGKKQRGSLQKSAEEDSGQDESEEDDEKGDDGKLKVPGMNARERIRPTCLPETSVLGTAQVRKLSVQIMHVTILGVYGMAYTCVYLACHAFFIAEFSWLAM